LDIIGEEHAGYERVLPTISGASNHRIFKVSNGVLLLKSVVISSGKVADSGGAVFVLFSGRAVLDQSIFTGNAAKSGGALAAIDDSTLDVRSSEFRDNTAEDGQDIKVEEGSVAKIVNAFFASHTASAVWAKGKDDVQQCSDKVCEAAGLELAEPSDCTDLSDGHGVKCLPANVPVVTALQSDSCNLEASTNSTAHFLTGCPTARSDAIVEVVGSGFGDSAGIVKIGKLAARIEEWSNQKIRFVLPKNVGENHRLLIQRSDDSSATNYFALVVLGIDLYGAIGDFVAYSLPKVLGIEMPDSAKNCSHQPMHKGLTTGYEFIRLSGYGFGPWNTSDIKVSIGGSNCTNVSWVSDSTITAWTPLGTGKAVPLVVSVENSISFPITFSYLPPRILNASVDVHGGLLQMSGEHFGVPGTGFAMSVLATREDVMGNKMSVHCRNIVHKSNTVLTCNYETWGTIDTCSGFLITVTINGQISNRFPICYGDAVYKGAIRYIKPSKELSIVEGKFISDRVYLSVEPHDTCKQIKVKVSSATPSICHVPTKVFTITTETAKTGKLIDVEALDDGIISSQTAPKGIRCQLTYNLLSSDIYYERVEETNRFLVVFGKGCGIGEYLGVAVRENNGTTCVCNKNYFRDNNGYCNECPEGGICDSIGTTIVSMMTKRNYWRETPTKSLFYACDENGGELDRDTPCIGGSAANATQCAEGHTGLLCAACQAGSVKRDRPNYIYGGDLCRDCDLQGSDYDMHSRRTVAIVVTISIIYVFTLWYVMGSKHSYHRTLPVGGDNELVIQEFKALKSAEVLLVSRSLVLLRHFQCVSFFGITFGVDWPFHFRSFFQWFGFLNLDLWNILSGFDVCSLVISFQDASIIHLTTPTMLVGIVGVANLTAYIVRILLSWKPCKKCATSKACGPFRKHSAWTAFHRSIKLFSVVLFVQLPGLVVRAFRVFRCRNIQNIGMVMREDVSVVCESPLDLNSEFGGLAIFSGSFAAVYGVFCPLLFLLVLREKEKFLWGDVGVSRTVQHIYGFLFMNYRSEVCIWWNQLDTFVRVLIFGVLAAVHPDNSIQLYLAVIIAMGYVLLLEEFRPYRQTLDNRILIASWVLIILTLVTGFALRTDVERRVYAHTSLSIFLVLMHTLFLIVVSFCAIVLPAKSAKLFQKLFCPRLAKCFAYCCKCNDGERSTGEKGNLVKTAPALTPKGSTNKDDHVRSLIRRHTDDNIKLDKKLKKLQRKHTVKVQSRIQARQKLKNSKVLKKVSLFEKLTDMELNEMIDAMLFHTFRNGTTIYEEGAYGDKLYAIVDGTVQVKKDGQAVREMSAPDVFGEGALLANDYKRTASIAPLTQVSLMSLSRAKYLELQKSSFSKNTSVPEELKKRLENYLEADQKRMEEHSTV
jgi:hypothetical protein